MVKQEQTFRVKNFERFQHYTDRNPPWIKLYNELIDNYDFCCLQDASKLHLILIWLLASRSGNKLPLDPEWIAARISATEKVDLAVLVEAGFLIINQPLDQHASKLLASCKHDASKMLATCYHRDRERERGRERKKGFQDSKKNGHTTFDPEPPDPDPMSVEEKQRRLLIVNRIRSSVKHG